MDLRGKKLGTILVELGLLDLDQEKAALEYARQWGIPFGRACVRMGFVDDELVVRALAVQMGAPSVSLAGIEVADEVLALLPKKYAEKHRAVPISLLPGSGLSRKGALVIAVATPKNVGVLDELSSVTGHRVSVVLASESDIDNALLRGYGLEIEAHTRASRMVDLERGVVDESSDRVVRDPLELAMEFLPTLEVAPHTNRR